MSAISTNLKALLPYFGGLATGAFFLYQGIFTHSRTTRGHDLENNPRAHKIMLQRHATLHSLGVDMTHMHEPIKRRISAKN